MKDRGSKVNKGDTPNPGDGIINKDNLINYEGMLKDLSRFLPAIFFEIDRDGTLLFADVPALRLSTATNRDVRLGHTRVQDLVIRADRERMTENIRKIFNLEKLPDEKLLSGEEYRFYNADREIRHFRVYSTPVIKKDVVTRLRGIALDDTERMHAERDLAESQRRLNTLMNNLPGMAYRCLNDPNWTMQFVSNGAQELTGYAAKELEFGKQIHYADLVHEDDRDLVWETVQKSLDQARSFQMIYRIKHKIKGVRWVWEQGQVVDKNDDGIDVLEGFITDINDKHMAEQELLRAKERAEQSDHLKTSFLANISHEIRTPLNAILGFSNLIHDEDLTDQQQKEYLSIVIRNGGQLLNLVNDIIDISLVETGQIKLYPRETDIGFLLKELQRVYQKKNERPRDVSIELELSGCIKATRFLIDEYRLKQILMNLLDNALKFTHKGKIIFGCTTLDSAEGSMELFVSDTGMGIPKEKQDQIFDRFYQVDNEHGRTGKGTGLGLAISKAYLDMMGGEISLSSRPGEGSTFNLRFSAPPTKETGNVSTPNYETGKEVNIKGKKILIVEDQPHNMRFLEAALQFSGVELIKTYNAEDALKLLRDGVLVDIVLMDIKLPGMSGLDATREIVKIRPGLPVIAQTAFAMTGDEQNALNAGCVDYISKPMTKERLLKKLKQHL